MLSIKECIEQRASWDSLFFTQALLVAKRSIDPSTQVGCIIVTSDNIPVSQGYNGPVRGFDVHKECNHPLICERPDKYHYVEHGERNAIYNAIRTGAKLGGTVLYVNFTPCPDCARAIVQSGIKMVKVLKQGDDAFVNGTGIKYDFSATHKIFYHGGVQFQIQTTPLIVPITIRMSGKDVTLQ